MNRLFFLTILYFTNVNGFSQLVYRHDVFNGGVCVAGFSTGLGVGTGVVELFVPPGSTIKKTLLMVYTCGPNTEGEVRINGQNFIFNSSNIVTSNELLNPFYSPVNFHVLDITDWFISSFTLNPTLETTVHPEMPFRGVFAPILYVEYENIDLPAQTSTIIINDQPIFGSSNYVINNLNPISTLYPVGFSLYTDRHSYNQTERTHVNFNNNYLGLVYGSDAVNQLWTGGVKGHFYRENNTLFGLDDDVPDNTMNETDALADVSPFINNLSTSVNFSLQQIVYPVVPISAINIYLAYFLNYTSPCQPFETTLLTSDTTTCSSSAVQLGVSVPDTVNATYEWLPQTNLSCYDCPNPIFTGDSTINYTLRIWASDSCSKVLPVRVRVASCASVENLANSFEIFAPTLINGDLGGAYKIHVKNVQQYEYELYSLDGKVVYQKIGFPESITLDLWDKALMESGMYLYRIWVRDEFGNQEVVSGKVVVVR